MCNCVLYVFDWCLSLSVSSKQFVFNMGRKRVPINLATSTVADAPAKPYPKKRKKRSTQPESLLTSERVEDYVIHENIADKKDEVSDKAVHEFSDYVWRLWLTNKESAKELQELAQKSSNAGAKGVSDIASIGKSGELQKNMARDLKRGVRRKFASKMPPLYYAEIPCWDDDVGMCNNISIPFLLPFEMIYKFLQDNVLSIAILCNVMVGTALESIKHSVCERLQIDDPSRHILLGLHSDGVPSQKSGASIEVQSFNFPNLPHCERNLWGVLEKRFFCRCGCAGRHTMDKIFELLVWASEHAWLGTFPSQRHDKQPWLKSDAWRQSMAGKIMGFTASFVEARMDWMAVKQVFSFGGWNAKRMCFKCRATQPNGEAPYTDVSSSALWRHMRLTMRAFFKELAEKHIDPSPLFSLPGFILDFIIIDVLHSVDLGCAADAAGSFFYELLHNGGGFLTGRTVLKRVQDLWAMVRRLYKQHKTPNRLQALTKDMICKKKANSKPKLKAKAAEMRHLVPIIVEIAKEYHARIGTRKSKAIVDLFSRLLAFYMSIGTSDFDPVVTETAIQEFALLYKALVDCKEGSQCWYMKPKLHLMQELSLHCHDCGDPANYWTYKDEDFVGLIAIMGSSKGGCRAPASVPENIFVRYCAL